MEQSKNRITKNYQSSIKDASIVRKFTTLFLIMSIIPLVVLYYFYVQIRDNGTIQVSAAELNVTLVFVVLGVGVGFFAMRSILNQIIQLTNQNKTVVNNLLSQDDAEKLEGSNEIEVLSRSFAAINTKLEENVYKLEVAKNKLHAVMTKVGHGIANIQNIDTFLELIVETVTNSLSGKVGTLMLYDKKENYVWIEAVYGVAHVEGLKKKVKVEEGTTISTVIAERKPIIVPRMMMDDIPDAASGQSLFDPPLICAPLISRDHVRGVLMVSGREEQGNFSEEEMSLLFNLATQTAIALDNAKLTTNIRQTYFETIAALALAVDAKDKYSRGHLDRVADYCKSIGEKLGLDDKEIKLLCDAARLHDLGKIGIPDDVLLKEEKLTDEEWILMRKHPEIGESIIRPIQSLEHLCDFIRHHHEKLDGSGYPDGLKGDEISPLVRILTVADIYDSLTTDRPYRRKQSKEQALKSMKEMTGEIDMDILGALMDVLNEKTD